MTDEIRLRLPAQEDFHPVAHLVVGGLGARLDLTFEDLEDVQVAVEALLACREDDDEITVALRIDPGAVHATVGPFPAGALASLEDDGGALGLRRVLQTVCDSFAVEERPGGDWVDLTKQTAASVQ